MCGICGMVVKDSSINPTIFEKMVNIIEHRGPDDVGYYYESGLALGHRRLSIIDLSTEGHQPFHYMDRYTVVYNGEIYNYIELKQELIENGYSFFTKTDTEVLIAAYDFWKEDCVNHFNGMWAFCIYDKEKSRLFCSRDRFGVKPFYYMIHNESFVFGSEIKQLLLALDGKPKANHDSLISYLVLGAVDYTSETMFEGVNQLMGGHNLTYNLINHEYKIDKWYDLSKVKRSKDSYDESVKRFREKFEQAVKLRLRADVPLGSCLSGGLDSSAIVTMADKMLKEKNEEVEQHVVSSCFEDKRYDEQEYIDEVVAKTDVTCHKIFPDINTLFNDLDKIIWHMDEPFASTSIYAQWNVFKTAKTAGLTVMLDGQGADEQLAGYTPFYQLLFVKLLKQFRFVKFFNEVKAFQTLRAAHEVRSTRSILKTAVAEAFLPRGLSQRLRKKFGAMSTNSPFSQEMLTHSRVTDAVQEYDKTNERKYIQSSMRQGMSSLLHYEDRNSMAHSIESRVPFLDYQLVESVYAMPLEYKIQKGITKAVLRDALTGILPDKIRTRYSKLGFVTPEDEWIRNNVDLFRSELQSACKALAGILQEEKVLQWFDANYMNFKRGDFTVWRIICAGRWIKLFNVEM
ncbi:MAG: asparagine synthase (glutamine-hydrolyzing) [Bacillota bacterium]|nr:asparagine synthase (glutamine-hydrolyzing) [Bacillota bacterium]